ncbi:MAG: exopolyphosphatase [Flavobacteriaceae bacterium]|nr:exopolyphosphatase [Flavobacteriaceae bacterium]
MLIANAINNNGHIVFSKNALVRLPIRLGNDTFTFGYISKKNIKRILEAINAFKLIMKIHNVIDYSAYATSAMREAKNGLDIVELIKNKSGIKIELIDGKKEAKLTSSLNLYKNFRKDINFLFVDVGGGSTEFSIIQNGKRVVEKSFKIGTVRNLNKNISDLSLNNIKKWITDQTKKFKKLSIFGTGGNINKIHRITNTEYQKPINYKTLYLLYKKMSELRYDQRIIKYQLNPDRADVILPALKIYLLAMKWSKSSEIFVPKKGLTDGMIEELYNKNLNI